MRDTARQLLGRTLPVVLFCATLVWTPVHAQQNDSHEEHLVPNVGARGVFDDDRFGLQAPTRARVVSQSSSTSTASAKPALPPEPGQPPRHVQTIQSTPP